MWSPVDVVERRLNRNVRAVTAAVFDIDHAEDVSVFERLEEQGFAFVLHSTHKHTPSNISLRVVFPLTRPVLPSEWPKFWAATIDALKIPADPQVKDISRAFFLPDTAEPNEPLAYQSAGNRPLDVDELLRSSGAGIAPRALPEVAAALPDAPVDLHGLAADLIKHAKPENRDFVRRHLRGEKLPPKEHDGATQRLMSVAGFVLDDSVPEDAVLELFRPCFSASVTDCGKDAEHHLKEARDMLRRARERRRERDAAELEVNTRTYASLGIALRRAKEPTDEGVEDPAAWAGELITAQNVRLRDLSDEDRQARQQLKNCEANVYAVLKHADEWRGVLRFNEVTKELEHSNGPLPNSVRTDGLDTEISVWFQQSDWGRLGLMPKSAAVRDIMRQVANANAYDPLRDYLEGLKWDAKPRLDLMLERYFGVTEDPEHVRVISAKWMISAVARAMNPGCKVDTVLILEGEQGLKKSSGLKALGGQWFTDQAIDIRSKDSWALVSRFWIIELAEGDETFRRSDWSALKGFLTRSTDTFRPPYGRVNVEFPRRSVFAATVNLNEYLKSDPTGYRRMWPVRCGSVDIAALKEDAPQLWAEAVVRYSKGEQWWLTDEQGKRAERHAREREESEDEPKKEAILRWILAMPPEKRPREVSLLSLAEGAFDLRPADVDRRRASEIGRVVAALKWDRVQRYNSGDRIRVYRVPDEVLKAPRTETARVNPYSLIKGLKSQS
jgi:predicted P-loop ATPase